MLEGSTIQPRPIFKKDAIWVAGIEANTAENGRLLLPSDIGSVSFSVYEQDSPNVETNEAVPDFENVPVPVEKAVKPKLETKTVYDKFGSRSVQFNTEVIIVPVSRTVDGETTTFYPLRTIGKYYRIEVTFAFVDPAIAPIVQTEMVYPI